MGHLPCMAYLGVRPGLTWYDTYAIVANLKGRDTGHGKALAEAGWPRGRRVSDTAGLPPLPTGTPGKPEAVPLTPTSGGATWPTRCTS
jgi:hypothetical protein